MGTEGLDEDCSGEVEWCSGNIRNIGATSATTLLLDVPDVVPCSNDIWWFDDDDIKHEDLTCEIV